MTIVHLRPIYTGKNNCSVVSHSLQVVSYGDAADGYGRHYDIKCAIQACSIVLTEPKTLSGMETEQKQQFRLERETELRCEVEWDASLKVKLVSGTAEIFGSEIAIGQQVTFDGGEKFAVSESFLSVRKSNQVLLPTTVFLTLTPF